MGSALPKDVKKGSGFKGSKVKRLDNSRIRSDVMSKTDFDELPSACSGPEPVEGSRVEARTSEPITSEPRTLNPE